LRAPSLRLERTALAPSGVARPWDAALAALGVLDVVSIRFE